MAYKIYIDFETKSELDLKKVGAAVYAAHPSTDVLCVAFKKEGDKFVFCKTMNDDGDYDDVGYIHDGDLWKKADSNLIFVAHGATFEYAIWHQIMVSRYGYPPIPLERWRCTMAKSASCGLPAKLELVAKVLELPAQKDMVGNQSMLALSRPKKDGSFWQPHEKPEMFEKLYRYCQQDVLVTQQLDERLPDLSEYEQRVWQLNENINQRGVLVDIPLVKTIVGLSREHKKFLGEEFRKETESDFEPSKRKKFQKWLSENGYDVLDTKATTLEKLKILPTEFETVPKVIKLFLEYNKTSLAKYGAMLKRVNTDNKLRGMHAYHSAHTGRFSGRGVQLQNLFRGTFKMAPLVRILQQGDYGFLCWAYGNASQALASAVRGVFIPHEGNDFYIGDLSGIEARILQWIVGNEVALKEFYDGVDPYVKAARQIYKTHVINKHQRSVGKVAVLALGYQGGIASVIKFSENYHVDLKPLIKPMHEGASMVEREDCKRDYEYYLKRCKKAKVEPCDKDLAFVCSLIKFRWRKENPKVVAFWKAIEVAAVWTVESKCLSKVEPVKLFMEGIFLCIQLPSGRRIKYPFPKVEGKKLSYYTMTIDRGWARVTTYGGSLTENIVQGIARDLFVDDMIAMDDDGKYDIAFHVHDEVVAEANGSSELGEFLSYLERCPTWAKGLPVKAEGWTGDRYEKR